jgi:hypothetical protein
MEEQDITLLICTTHRCRNYRVRGCSWVPVEEAEQDLYQRYLNFPLSKSVDELQSSWRGNRFINSALLYDRNVRSLLPPGCYVGAMLVLSTPEGFKILAPVNRQFCLPCVKIDSKRPSKENIRWLQGLRERRRRGASSQQGITNLCVKMMFIKHFCFIAILGDEHYVTFVSERDSFKQKFYHALNELKHQLQTEYDSFGEFYDEEVIEMSENNDVQMVCIYTILIHYLISNLVQFTFGAILKTANNRFANASANKMQEKFVWVSREQFEVCNYKIFCEVCRNAVYGRAIDILRGLADLHDDSASDTAKEGLKKMQHKAHRQLANYEKKWQPFCWVDRVINWLAKGSPSLVDRAPKR